MPNNVITPEFSRAAAAKLQDHKDAQAYSVNFIRLHTISSINSQFDQLSRLNVESEAGRSQEFELIEGLLKTIVAAELAAYVNKITNYESTFSSLFDTLRLAVLHLVSKVDEQDTKRRGI
jgi:hypothetical protein